MASLNARKDGERHKSVKPLGYPEKPEAPSASADGLEGRKLGLHDAPDEGRVCEGREHEQRMSQARRPARTTQREGAAK